MWNIAVQTTTYHFNFIDLMSMFTVLFSSVAIHLLRIRRSSGHCIGRQSQILRIYK